VSYIKIPLTTKEQIWSAFLRLCDEKEAATPAGEQLPPISLRLDKPPSDEDRNWLLSQRLPGRYARCCLNYDSHRQELCIPLMATPVDR
jgi:hypothetical protein